MSLLLKAIFLQFLRYVICKFKVKFLLASFKKLIISVPADGKSLSDALSRPGHTYYGRRHFKSHVLFHFVTRSSKEL